MSVPSLSPVTEIHTLFVATTVINPDILIEPISAAPNFLSTLASNHSPLDCQRYNEYAALKFLAQQSD